MKKLEDWKLTYSQKELIGFLSFEAVYIELENNGKYYLKKFGVKVRAIAKKTINAIEPYVIKHDFDGRITYTLNKNISI